MVPFQYILRVLSIEREEVTETELLYRWWNIVYMMEGKTLGDIICNVELLETQAPICIKFFSYFYWTSIEHCFTHPLISPRAPPFRVATDKCYHIGYGKPTEGGEERLDWYRNFMSPVGHASETANISVKCRLEIRSKFVGVVKEILLVLYMKITWHQSVVKRNY
jgi:hypothetical protein